VIRPEAGELLWGGGDAYDLYPVLERGVCLVDRRDDRVSFVVEAGDFVGELGMLMGQPAFLAGGGSVPGHHPPHPRHRLRAGLRRASRRRGPRGVAPGEPGLIQAAAKAFTPVSEADSAHSRAASSGSIA